MGQIERIEKKLKEKIKKLGLDGFLFADDIAVFYLSGFKSTNAYIILTEKDNIFLTDGRYYLRAKEFFGQSYNWELKYLQTFKDLIKAVKELSIRKLGILTDKISYSFYKRLEEILKKEGIEIFPIEGFLNEFRMIKAPDELEKIKKAVEITELAFSNLLEFLKTHRNWESLKEKDLRKFLICQYLELGAEKESFPSIIASGKNSAVPHHETGEKRLRKGENLLIDTGCVYQGYCSDFTRTLFIGKNQNKELLKIYEIVREAYEEALNSVEVGKAVGEIDLIAREYINSKGYGKYFNHSTGHGVGIEIHEAPRVYKEEKIKISEGMVFTIEPGIYIPDIGGVRLENIIVVDKGKGRALQKFPLEPIII
jgi:Xaa-Pro aminopeptidase/Xaa-Pro dipeptidase